MAITTVRDIAVESIWSWLLIIDTNGILRELVNSKFISISLGHVFGILICFSKIELNSIGLLDLSVSTVIVDYTL